MTLPSQPSMLKPSSRASVGAFSMMRAYWEDNPEYKVAFDRLNQNVYDFPFSVHLSKSKTAILNANSTLIINGTSTPEEAITEHPQGLLCD